MEQTLDEKLPSKFIDCAFSFCCCLLDRICGYGLITAIVEVFIETFPISSVALLIFQWAECNCALLSTKDTLILSADGYWRLNAGDTIEWATKAV